MNQKRTTAQFRQGSMIHVHQTTEDLLLENDMNVFQKPVSKYEYFSYCINHSFFTGKKTKLI